MSHQVNSAFITPYLPRHIPRHTNFTSPRCNLYNDGPRDQLKALRERLSAAVSAQNFSLAAQLRDQIQNLESTASEELAVGLANEAFYEALRSADTDAMGEIWLPSDSVSCAEAMSGFSFGFDNVIDRWRRVFTAGRPTQVSVQEVNVTVRRNVAWVICRQIITSVRGSISLGGERVATNIFQKKGGEWLMVHHHASPITRPDEPVPPPPTAA